MKKNSLTEKELARRDVIDAFNQGHITRSAAAEQLSIGVRQLHILRERYRLSGEQGLMDRRRFTKGNFRKPAPLKAQVMGLIKNDYVGLGPTGVCRRLATECGLTLHLETVRSWMVKAGISTARRNSYHVGDIGKSARVVKTVASPITHAERQRRHCLPPRLFRERRVVLPVEEAANAELAVAPEVEAQNAQTRYAERSTKCPMLSPEQYGGRIPSMAELDGLFAQHGTSAAALDEFAVNLAIQLMVDVGRPVTEEEIEAYVDEHEPNLRPLLRLIDAAREERRKRYGKRLTIAQRQTILVMLSQGVSAAHIARYFEISPGSIATYKRQLEDMDDEDRAGRLT